MRKSLSRMRHTVEEMLAGGQQADLRPFVLKIKSSGLAQDLFLFEADLTVAEKKTTNESNETMKIANGRGENPSRLMIIATEVLPFPYCPASPHSTVQAHGLLALITIITTSSPECDASRLLHLHQA